MTKQEPGFYMIESYECGFIYDCQSFGLKYTKPLWTIQEYIIRKSLLGLIVFLSVNWHNCVKKSLSVSSMNYDKNT